VVIKPDALFKDLYSDISSQLDSSLHSLIGKGIYPPDLTPLEYAALSVSNSFLKKYSDETAADADDLALRKFIDSNNRSMNWELQLNTSLDEELYGGFKSAIYDFFNPEGYELELNPVIAAKHGNVGPGSGLLANGTDFYTKMFSGPLSCTSQSLYNFYSRSISGHPTWSLAEKARASKYGGAMLCKGNRLCFVPKTTEISRVICVEPVLNMYFQLGVKHILERRLKNKLEIDLSVQPAYNRELARLGSNGWGYSTIDLESASDTISTKMLEATFPKGVLNDLKRYRSQVTLLPNQDELQLGMFSSMGNAFTFPLQTIIFSCIVCSVYRYLNIPIEKPRGHCGNFGVFGDDIVCRSDATNYIIKLLTILGFTVNKSKSFWEGSFRESCGADYYHGRLVRGVYLRGNLPQNLLSTLNLLVEFSANTGVFLPRVCSSLRTALKGRLTPVPRWENDDAGWKVPLSFFAPKVDDNGSFIYKAYIPFPRCLRVTNDEVISPFREKKRFFNPDGLMISFLGRSVNAMTIPVRQDRVRYRRKQRVAPNWSFASFEIHNTTRHRQDVRANWKRWETAFYLSL